MIILLCLIGSAICQKPLQGPYEIESKTYEVKTLDSSDQHVDVYYPKAALANSSKFSFISYAHGWGGGGDQTPKSYGAILTSIASWGYIIAAPQACNRGCEDDSVRLPREAPGFGHFYKQQLLAIEWAKSGPDKEVTEMIDFSKGVGIAGHSYGGQATVFSSSYNNASAYDIKAAVMHHAFTHEHPAPQIPFLAMTGSSDIVAGSSMTENYFNAPGANPHRGLVNKNGATHMEPIEVNPAYNPLLAQFTAAWFKVYLDLTPKAYGVDFDSMLFGKDGRSICGGGDGAMAECEMHK